MKIIFILFLGASLFSQSKRYINQTKHTQSSEAVIVGNLIYISGLVGTEKNGNVPLSAEDQTTLIFTRLKKILQTHKSSFKNIITLKSYHTDMEEIEEYKFVRNKFIQTNFPTTSILGVTSFYDRRYKVMIDIIAELK